MFARAFEQAEQYMKLVRRLLLHQGEHSLLRSQELYEGPVLWLLAQLGCKELVGQLDLVRLRKCVQAFLQRVFQLQLRAN